MDEVTHNMVVAQLKSANGEKALHNAIVSALIAVVDCQKKTGDRVKRQGVLIAALIGVIVLMLVLGNEQAVRVITFARGGEVAQCPAN